MMIRAWRQASKSPDPSTQLGAILVSASLDYIHGYNHIPEGKFCSTSYYLDREQKYARVIHAEEHCIITAARLGISTKGATLVCPWACCVRCAGIIAEAGIKRLIVDKAAMDRSPERWKKSIEDGHTLLRDCGVIIDSISLVGKKPETRFDGEVW